MRTLPFLLLFLSGCILTKQSTPVASTVSTTPAKSETCPDKPIGSLDSSKVKAITLTFQDKQESGMVKAGESLGFSFESKGNEKFNYATKENLCVWVFSPDNQVLQGTKLSQKGRYTVQISIPKGSSSFELAMRLEDAQQSKPNKTNTVVVEQIAAPAATPAGWLINPKASSPPIQESTERVNFAKGSSTGTVQDTIAPSQLKHYLLQCGGGQSMTVRSQNSAVNVRIVAPDGSTIGRIPSGSSSWQGTLPSDGDYSVDVSSPGSTSFSIQVEVL
jgi:hypothetical protein